MPRILRNVLLSFFLICIGGAALGLTLRLRTEAAKKAKIYLSVGALEQSLLRGLSQATKPDEPFELNGEVLGTLFHHRLAANETLTLDRNLSKCMNYPSEVCGYKIKLVFDARKQVYSFEVTSSFAEAPISVRAENRFAIESHPVNAVDNESLAQLKCDPRKAIAVNGYSTSTGLQCLQKPEVVCPLGSVPKKLQVTGAVPRLEFECGEPLRTARCPANYSIEKIDTRSLDGGGKIKGVCVRTTLARVAPPTDPPPAPRLSGRACPYGYKSDSACFLTNIKAKPGRCGEKGVLVQPVAGKAELVQNATLGFVDCAVRNRQQSCGAQWSADVQLKIGCVLDQGERIDVQ